MLSQAKISRSFQRALSTYNSAAVVQKNCAQELMTYLHSYQKSYQDSASLERVFEFGCGTGFLTKHLVNQFTMKDFFVNDLIADCKSFLLDQGINKQQFNFIGGDIEQITIPQSCDLICSSSYLQWSIDQKKLLGQLTNALKENGCLAISSFSEGHFGELTFIHEQQNKQAHSNALNYWTVDMWQEYLQANYKIELIKEDEHVLWFESVNELLMHLRHTGVNGNAGENWSQQLLTDFKQQYEKLFSANNKVPLSYRPIYIIARKIN